MELKKVTPIKLREAGKDEKWLQNVVEDDPSILGLGDLAVIERERIQYSGGRIDFLLYNPEDSVRYEVEIMLGTLDESHIIRTIEYWDIERRRFPNLEHRAVIVAEEITNRFFNVIGLLNRAVPIIAVQLNAFSVDDSLMMNFVKVLDICEPGDEEEQGTDEPTDRKYWESKANQKSMQAMDRVINVFPKETTRITYNKNHVALGTTGRNFLWFHPRKASHIHFDILTSPEIRDEYHQKFEESGITCTARSNPKRLKVQITSKEIEAFENVVKELLIKTEKLYER
jgi:hypothetical protein